MVGGYALAREYPDGWVVGPHCHWDGQFVHAIAGVMEIRAAHRLWLVPPQRAVWIPPYLPHELRARGPVSLRTLYIAPDRAPRRLGQAPGGYAVTPLLRELIVRAVEQPDGDGKTERAGRLWSVLLDEMEDSPIADIALPIASDPRLIRVCEAVMAFPEHHASVADLARAAGMSARTLSRLAQEELGAPLSIWRQQARVVAAIPALVAGHSVIETAQNVGYETPSAFAAMFKRIVGMTPTAFSAQREVTASVLDGGAHAPPLPNR